MGEKFLNMYVQVHMQTQTEIQKEPRIEVVKLYGNKLYVKIGRAYFELENVELHEVENTLYEIIRRYDPGGRFVSLKSELLADRKIVVENESITVYDAPFESIIVDFALYLVARVAEDDYGAYALVMQLGNYEKEFIMHLVEKHYKIDKEQLKRIYRVMETVVKILNPGYITSRGRSRSRRNTDTLDYFQ